MSPLETFQVLDADSSQLVAVEWAKRGANFVIEGPPGTGKSQTIANMIGALLHAGKTVLFVSEKAAALDVVRDRLAHAGLGRYLLELHSHKAARKEVAASLASALDAVPAAPTAVPPTAVPPTAAPPRAAAQARRSRSTRGRRSTLPARRAISAALTRPPALLITGRSAGPDPQSRRATARASASRRSSPAPTTSR